MGPTMIQRFLDGFDLRGETIDRIASVMGMKIIETDDAHPDLRGDGEQPEGSKKGE